MDDAVAALLCRQSGGVQSLDISYNEFGRGLLVELRDVCCRGDVRLERLNAAGNMFQSCGDALAALMRHAHTLRFYDLSATGLWSRRLRSRRGSVTQSLSDCT
jgi:hypothetical protein